MMMEKELDGSEAPEQYLTTEHTELEMTQPPACEWSQPQTFKLLDLWHERLREISGANFRSRDYHFITERFNEGLLLESDQRSIKQIQAKIEGLKKTYNKRLHARNSTGKNRKSWIFFDKLDELLAGRIGPAAVNGAPSHVDDLEEMPLNRHAKRMKRAWAAEGSSSGPNSLGKTFKQVGDALAEALDEWRNDEREFRKEMYREEREWRMDMMKMQMEYNLKMAELVRSATGHRPTTCSFSEGDQ